MNSRHQQIPLPFERVLLSRQPIYSSDMNVFAYELLFRDGESDKAFFANGTRATAKVIVNALMEIGMDAIVGHHPAFINCDRKLLVDNYCEALPHDRVVLEILETVEPDAKLFKKLEQLRSKGYRIALDDFVCAERYLPLLEFADFVKLDLLAGDWSTVERSVSAITKYPVKLLAEKVETREQADACKELGFRYFQGYFFCQPQNMPGKALPANRLAILRLLAQLNTPGIRMDELEHTIRQDLSVSYKLLRYINSAMCGLARDVKSIRHATVLVGLERMRLWASLIAFSGINGVPRDVIVTGAVRARMCELLATELRLADPEGCSLAGLFSVLDAILDRPIEQILPQLSLSDEIKNALLNHGGELGSVLRCVKAYEQHLWNDAQAIVHLDQQCIEQAYNQALAWSANMIGLTPQPKA